MDLKKFFSEPSTLVVLISSGVIGLIVGVANGVVQKKHGGWGGFIAAIASATAVAIIVGLALDGYIHSETLKLAIIGACAVISDDIVAGLKSLGSGFRVDPLGAVARIIDALRGKAASAPASPKE